ncbi:MAG: ribosome-associated translation inhibitor RaiA [Chloroflexi bacterium]|uniref:ribosome hibernation-promoting factor, HPF/YfiA family n=1 Tax=Candidatus Flexifilum breve TaxID=3140694 RepID=UPI00313493D3|nr:ribosome-associated translation inhibitor RaiA [Chloroflexota bacterium]
MEIQVRGDDLKITETLEEYAQKKLARLDKYLPNIQDVRVDFSRQHTRRGDNILSAQITIRHQRGAILRAEETSAGDAEAALNLAIEKIHRQIERFKSKRSRKGRPRFSASVEELSAAETAPNVDVLEEEEVDPIIRHKEVYVTAMNEDEAIEQMELLGHTFFIFFNDQTQTVNVVYKRRTSGYGVLIPKTE